MFKSNLTFREAIAQLDRSPTTPAAAGYRSQRAELLKRFPRDKWPEMRLEDYALGQPAGEDTYCHWLEFRSRWVGSIRGGSARKLIIYKRKHQEGWYFPNVSSNESEAWDRLRSDFLQAFDLAGRGDWERIDELETPCARAGRKVEVPAPVFPRRRAARLLDRASPSFPTVAGSPPGGGQSVVGGGAESVPACGSAAGTSGGGLEHGRGCSGCSTNGAIRERPSAC